MYVLEGCVADMANSELHGHSFVQQRGILKSLLILGSPLNSAAKNL